MRSRKVIKQSSSPTSGLPPEIWALIGEQFRCRETLLSLVQVCRSFKAIFDPFLYEERVLCLELLRLWGSKLQQKSVPPGLAFGKSLEVRICDFEESGISYDIDLNKNYRCFLGSVIQAMPNLKSFKWVDKAFEPAYGPCAILKAPLLDLLKSSCTLKHLSIQFGAGWVDDLSLAAKMCFCSLKGFHNLTSLELYHFSGTQSELVGEIAEVLSYCPGLGNLGLGLACDGDVENLPEAVFIEGDRDFLEMLCLSYATHTKTPLSLKKLRLGYGMCLHESDSRELGNFLAKLVNLAGLKTLHVFNGLSGHSELMDSEAYYKIDIKWSLLDGCKSLHQLCVTRLEEDVKLWLNGDGQSVRELIITYPYEYEENDFKQFRELKLPHLSRLHTRQEHETGRITNWFGPGSQPNFGPIDGSPITSDTQPLPNMTFDMTALDALMDGGCQLRSLCLWFHFQSQWERFSTHLPKLVHLTELRLARSGGPRFPPPVASLWPKVQRPKDIAFEYAELLQFKCPSLQRIYIGEWGWRVHHNAVPAKITRRYRAVELQEIARDEMYSTELFQYEHFPHQSGLPGPEEAWALDSDDDLIKTEERMADFDRGYHGRQHFEHYPYSIEDDSDSSSTDSSSMGSVDSTANLWLW